MPAPPVIVKAPVMNGSGVIAVARAHLGPELLIIPAPGVLIEDQGRQGSSCGHTLEEAALDLHQIPFLPLGGMKAAGLPPIHFLFNGLHIQDQSRRQAVQDNPDGFSMGFSEYGHGDIPCIYAIH